MNTAIDSTFKKYDFIYDGGCTEHIFNVPQVLENIIDFLEVGGIFCGVTPNNNLSGHGMYQFSPELFLSCFTKTYGMEIIHMWIAIAGSEDLDSWIDVYNNKYTDSNRTTQKFDSSEGVYVVVIARKVSDDRESLIKKPPNQFSYEQVDWKKSVNNKDISRMGSIEDIYKRHLNTPSDINEHLPVLRRYASECSVIAECGVRGIVSTWAFLAGLCDNKTEQTKELISVDIEHVNFWIPEILGEEKGIDVKFIQHNSATVEFGKRIDLLFIDTLHVYGHLKRELKFHANNVNKYIIMHDTTLDGVMGECLRSEIWTPGRVRETVFNAMVSTGYPFEEICRGLWPAIEEFLLENPEWKLLEKLENNNGLTVLHRTSLP